jgi:tetratricopeptide (TPR) repeat protein
MNDMQSIARGIEVARQRHAAYYRSVLANADKLYLGGGDEIVQGLALFDTERANIETGQSWAAEHAVADEAAASLCLEYSYAGQCVLPFRLHPHERIEWLEASLAASRKLKRRDTEGDELNSLGSAYYYMGEIGRAIECYEQSLIIKRETGDRPGEGAALGNLGLAYQHLGETRRAIECFEQHLAIARETLTRRGEGKALGNLGLAYEALGEPRRALEFFDQRLVIALEIGDRVGEAHALNGMGKSYASLGETRRAIEYFERSLVIKREMKDSTSEGETLYNLGCAYMDLGETGRVIACFEQSLAIARETGNRSRENFVLRCLGNAYLELGEPRRAIEFYEQSLVSKPELGERRDESRVLDALGSAYAGSGEPRRAIEIYEQSLVIKRETGDRMGEGLMLRSLGFAYLELGEPRRATALFEQWAAIACEIGDHRGEAYALSTLQKVYADLNKTQATEQAETHYYRALITRMRARWPEHRATAESLNSLASIYLMKKREAELQDEGLIKFCHSLGLPEGLITGETMSLYVLPCLVQVYTDDEIRTKHAPPEDQRLVEWFGYRNFEEGRFLCELAAVRDGRRRVEGGDMIGFQRALAASFAHHLATGEGSFPAFGRTTIPALARIDGADLFFGGNYGQGEYREQMERPIKHVLALDPGVRAIHTIDQLLRLRTNDPASLFHYTTISSHPFIAQLLLEYLRLGDRQTDVNDRLAPELEKDGIYQSLEGDLTVITQMIIDEKRQRKQPADSLDIVIYLDLFPPKLARDSAPLVLSNAYRLLRRGGALLLGFPLTENSEKHITMLELTKMAGLAGFVSGRSRVHIGTSNLAKPDLPVYAFFVKE